jgi:hypothetical protein
VVDHPIFENPNLTGMNSLIDILTDSQSPSLENETL